MVSLDVQNLTKSFGKVRALDGVTFQVGSGEMFGFVGSNGAGKTTTMRIIMGVLTPDGGQVRWNGNPITFAERRRIGYMPEERGLYPKMPVGQQLTYLAQLQGLSPKDAKAAAKQRAGRLSIANRWDDDVQKLSLGNQQRVQLAAALVSNPAALILDEPFSGLDPVAVEVMSSVLRERAAAGVPVIFSSHQLDLVERLCDRVGIISDGRMVAVGTIEELRATERPQFIIEGLPHEAWAPRLRGHRIVSVTPGANGIRTVIEMDHTLPDGASLPLPDGADPTSHDVAAATFGPTDQARNIAAAGQAVLNTALAAGPVHEFSRNKPHLTDLYRHVVTAEEKTLSAPERHSRASKPRRG